MPDHTDDAPPAPIELSVVIPAFNAAATIAAQLDALQGQQWDAPWEVIVADNGSTDDTAVLVAQRSATDARIRIVDASATKGPAAARNAGAAAAIGSSIAFCDADDVVGDHWVETMGATLRRVPFVTGPQEYRVLNEPWLHGVYGTRSATELQYFAGIFPFGPSANLGIHRNVFAGIGGFDSSLAVGEDLDLCMRLWLQGVALEFVPGALVHYRYRESFRALWRQAITYGAASPVMARRLAESECPTPSRWHGARNWVWLVRKLPSLRSKAGRARWVVVAGGSAGRLVGSIRARFLML